MIFTFSDNNIGMDTELQLTQIGKEYLIEITNVINKDKNQSSYSVAKLNEEEATQLYKELKRLTKN